MKQENAQEVEENILDLLKYTGDIPGSEFALVCCLYYSSEIVYSTLNKLFNEKKFSKKYVVTNYKLPDGAVLEYYLYRPNYSSAWERVSYLFRKPKIRN